MDLPEPRISHPTAVKAARNLRERQKARTRDEIFEAALRLFAERGYASATIREVCAAAGVARATFFLHFPSKAALLEELDRRLAAELAARLEAAPGSAVSEYRTAVDWLCDRWSQHADALAAVLREPLERSAEAMEPAGAGLRQVIEGIVRRGQRRGELRRSVPARLAATVFLTTAAAVLSSDLAGELSRPEELRNRWLGVLLQGLREPKPRLKWRRDETEGKA